MIWKKLTICCPQAYRTQTVWNQKVDDADSSPTNQKNVHELITSCFLHIIRLLLTPSRVDHTVLRALAHCDPFRLAKQYKLLFSTSSRALSLHFYSEPVTRGQSLVTVWHIYTLYIHTIIKVCNISITFISLWSSSIFHNYRLAWVFYFQCFLIRFSLHNSQGIADHF